jgi:hypothetical protein
MSGTLSVELRELVDHLARRGVAWIAVTQGEETLEIGLRPVVSPAAAVTPPPGRIVTAQGAGMPCLEAGDFLFPVAGPVAGEEGDEVLAAAGAVVGYGTPLLRRTRTA